MGSCQLRIVLDLPFIQEASPLFLIIPNSCEEFMKKRMELPGRAFLFACRSTDLSTQERNWQVTLLCGYDIVRMGEYGV